MSDGDANEMEPQETQETKLEKRRRKSRGKSEVGENDLEQQPVGAQGPEDLELEEINDEEETEQKHRSPKKKGREVGLTEEELEEFRDDPFWKKCRWICFIVFWLIWLLLLVIAVLLIVNSPRCASRWKPNWWQTAITYNVWVPSFYDSNEDGTGDMEGLLNRLENLRKSGVNTIWPSPFLKIDESSYAVRDYYNMDSLISSPKEISEKIHEKGMKLVMTLPIATTSIEHDWFKKSLSANAPGSKNYTGFYHWTSKTDKKYFTQRKDSYYMHKRHNKDVAVLNWKDQNLRQEMLDVLRYWIDYGVDGFYLEGIEYLARNDDNTKPDWPAVSNIVSDIRYRIDSHVNRSDIGKKIALFASMEGATKSDKRSLAENGLDTIINKQLTKVPEDGEICQDESVAKCVHGILSDVLQYHEENAPVWPHWELGNQYLSRVASRVKSRAHGELLLMLQLLLPGTNNIYYGDELGMVDLGSHSEVPNQRGAMQWEDAYEGGFTKAKQSKVPISPDYKQYNWKDQWKEEKSTLKMFSKLSKLRTRDDTLMSGHTLLGDLSGDTFTIVRYSKSGENITGSIYVGAFNFSPNRNRVDFDDVPQSDRMGKVQIVTTTSNVRNWFLRQETTDFKDRTVILGNDQGVVFRFVADKK